MSNVRDILLDIGYSNITDNGREFRMKPLYRDSSSNTVLSVRKDTGHFIDFSKNLSGSLAQLVQLSLKLTTVDEAKKWLSGKQGENYESEKREKPHIETSKKFPKDFLTQIIPNHEYWLDRGISKETLEIFNGGVCKSGKMKDRYVFPIFNCKKELVGVSGRDLINDKDNNSRPKWKHIGDKKEWKYPLQINFKILKNKREVILVESIGDMLSLWEAGVAHSVVTFGLNINTSVINLLLRLDPQKIIISLNNDEDNNNAGNIAAGKAKNKLLKYFDEDQILVKLPPKKDFGEMSKEEIRDWERSLA